MSTHLTELSTIDFTSEQFRDVASEAVEIVCRQLDSIREASVRQPVPEKLREAILNQPLPEQGCNPKELLQRVEKELFPYPMGNTSPRFFAWINSPPAPMAIIADLLASAINPSLAGGDHAATYVEHAVLNWLKEILGFGRNSGAILTSGGSMANFTCLAVMRRRLTSGIDRTAGLAAVNSRLRIYASDQCHFCVERAALLLGLGLDNVRKISTNSDFQIDLDALTAAIEEDKAAGLRPACVVGSAGTVNTGAIDDLQALADICRQEQIWFHVDGAFGGVGLLVEEIKHLFSGMERADSIAVDPHKWLYMPVDCGCAIVADRQEMRETFSMVPEYISNNSELPWLMEFGPQQTRRFNALKLWLVIQQIGVSGYRALISRDIELAKTLREKLSANKNFTIKTGGPLSVTCFQFTPPGVTPPGVAPHGVKNIEVLNQKLLEMVQREGRVFLTSTRLKGELVLRANIVNFRTTEADLDTLVETIEETGNRVKIDD